MKPLCVPHIVEMICIRTGELVVYPLAQYIYHGDVWRCPVTGCDNTTFLRAADPAIEGHQADFYYERERAYMRMWNV